MLLSVGLLAFNTTISNEIASGTFPQFDVVTFSDVAGAHIMTLSLSATAVIFITTKYLIFNAVLS